MFFLTCSRCGLLCIAIGRINKVVWGFSFTVFSCID